MLREIYQSSDLIEIQYHPLLMEMVPIFAKIPSVDLVPVAE